MMKKQVLVYFLALCNPFVLLAQVEMARSLAAIQDLKNGFLLVKLPTKTRELKAYEEQLQRFSKDLGHVEHIKDLRATDILENRFLQSSMIEGLKIDYSFSDVVITYDTSKTIFYDKNMVKKEDFSLENKTYLILNNQMVMKEDNILKNAFALSDKKGNILKYPFPSDIPIRFKNLRLLKYDRKEFQRVSSAERAVYREKYGWRDLDKNPHIALIKMLNLRMNAFYNLTTLGK